MFKLSIKKPFIIRVVKKSALSLDHFKDKYNIEVFVYPIFKKSKCNYDSFPKIGYHYQILEPNKGSCECYHIDCRFMEIFPENLLDLEDEEYNTLEKMGYEVYKNKKEAEEKALDFLISVYYPQTT